MDPVQPAGASTAAAHYPPELIINILEAIPEYPASVRRRTLAAACRVNRAFLEIARPLLYSSVHLKPDASLYDESGPFHRLVRTLVESPHCAQHVKRLRISAFGARSADWLIVQILLRHLDLDTLKVGGDGSSKTLNLLIRAVIQDQPRLKELCLPTSTISEREFGRLFPALPDLKVFKGRIWVDGHASLATPPTFHLSELYLGWGPGQDAFDYATQSSLETLTHLTLTMNDWRATTDLSRLGSLTSLTIWAESHGGSIFGEALPGCLDAFTNAIVSTKDLPIRTLSLAGTLQWGRYPRNLCAIVESFPRSLENLVLGPIASHSCDWDIFFCTLSNKPSSLRRIVVDESEWIRLCPEQSRLYGHDEKCRTWLDTSVEQLERLKCVVEFRSIWNDDKRFNQFLGHELDPFGESSEVELDCAHDDYDDDDDDDDDEEDDSEEVSDGNIVIGVESDEWTSDDEDLRAAYYGL